MRRGFLTVVLVGLVVMSGCLGYTGQQDEPSDTSPDSPTITSDPFSVDNGTVVVNRVIYDEQVKFYSGNETVRYVAKLRHTNEDAMANGSAPEREPVYEFMAFEEWAEMRCLSVGSKSVLDLVDQRLNGKMQGIGVGTQTSDDPLITVNGDTTLDRDGNVVSEPSVSEERLKEATPTAVEVTITLDEQSYSCSAPVKTEIRTVHEA